MFEVGYTLEQFLDFLIAEHGGQFLGAFAEGDHRDVPGSWHGDSIEESESGDGLVEGTPTDFLILHEMDLILPDLFGSEIFCGFIEVAEELLDLVGVGIDGTLGHVTDEHILGHTFGGIGEVTLLIGGHERRLSCFG